MLTKILFPILALLAMLALWLGVQALARRTAEHIPNTAHSAKPAAAAGVAKAVAAPVARHPTSAAITDPASPSCLDRTEP